MLSVARVEWQVTSPQMSFDTTAIQRFHPWWPKSWSAIFSESWLILLGYQTEQPVDESFGLLYLIELVVGCLMHGS